MRRRTLKSHHAKFIFALFLLRSPVVVFQILRGCAVAFFHEGEFLRVGEMKVGCPDAEIVDEDGARNVVGLAHQ